MSWFGVLRTDTFGGLHNNFEIEKVIFGTLNEIGYPPIIYTVFVYELSHERTKVNAKTRTEDSSGTVVRVRPRTSYPVCCTLGRSVVSVESVLVGYQLMVLALS